MIKQLTDFLNIIIFQNSWIFINFWSIVHFISGGLIFALIYNSKKKTRSFVLLVILLILWEVFEFIMYGVVKTSFIRVEIYQDVISDLVFGVLGGSLVFLIFSKLNKNSKKKDLNNPFPTIDHGKRKDY